jgi:hypothetical protein
MSALIMQLQLEYPKELIPQIRADENQIRVQWDSIQKLKHPNAQPSAMDDHRFTAAWEGIYAHATKYEATGVDKATYSNCIKYLMDNIVKI